MDQASGNPLHNAIELQGALLGKHEEDLSTARRAVDSLTAQLSDLTQQFHHYRHETTASAGQRDSSEPRINNPPCYSGEPLQCRAFLTQCEVVFSLQPFTYAKDRSKVAYVISLLNGRAREWAAANWEAEVDCIFKFSLFKEEMIRVFDRSAHGDEASRLLSTLRQGKRSVTDFSIEFRTLATTSGWNGPALIARFLEGLNSEIKDEVFVREVPNNFDSLVELALRIERRFEMRRRARRMEASLLPASTETQPPLPSGADPEPMQLGGLRISTRERQRRIMNRLCMYCAAADHFVSRCPVKASARQ